MKIIIGSRGSRLALSQTKYIKKLIEKAYPDWDIDIKVIKTKGDMILDREISQIGGKEVFVKEIEAQLLDGQIHMAVHSMKDMLGTIHPDLMLSFVPPREDPRDVLILKEGSSIDQLCQGAKIGTGSKRRAYQLKKLRPDVEIVPIRGNVETRIRKIQEENLDGVVLAAAGIHRLGLDLENMVYLSLDDFFPSPGQGILAIELKRENESLHQALMVLNDRVSSIQAHHERAYLKAVGGSCTVPVGAYCQVESEEVILKGILGDDKGNLVAGQVRGKACQDLGPSLAQDLEEKLKNPQTKPKSTSKGKVYLIGAGSGDPELLTLKGKRAMEEADLIVYDRLASPQLLGLNPKAKKIYVGKSCGNHTKTQDQINQILYDYASQGLCVARLKGGDPYVFGRGGEEALYLKERGVCFETIPGISSAIAGPAYSGIPITHRDIATSFHVITGHNKDNNPLDYQALARLKGTLVFLMGFSNLENISQGLIGGGMDKDTPVAVIQWATSPRQKVVEARLEDIYQRVQDSHIGTPAIIVVGQVVGLRKDLNFFESLPLFGQNLVITREEKRARSTIDKLTRLGANVLSFPMIETVFVDSDDLARAIDQVESYDYIYFSSVNGVDFFMEKFLQVSDIRRLARAKFCTIGTKTYRALEKYGIKADLMPDHFEGMEAVEVLKAHVRPGEKVLVPRASLGRNETVDHLKAHTQVDEVLIYDTVLADSSKDEILDRLKNYDDLKYIFTSSSTFNNFAKVLGDDLDKVLAKGQIVSIGPITSQTIRDRSYKVDLEAEVYTIDGIIDILK